MDEPLLVDAAFSERTLTQHSDALLSAPRVLAAALVAFIVAATLLVLARRRRARTSVATPPVRLQRTRTQ